MFFSWVTPGPMEVLVMFLIFFAFLGFVVIVRGFVSLLMRETEQRQGENKQPQTERYEEIIDAKLASTDEPNGRTDAKSAGAS